MTTIADRFHALHAGPDVLLLPNAWDAASAALMADAGAKAVATSSAAVAWARGYADGDAVPVAAVVDTVASIARVVSVPVTADIEGGYTDDLPTLAETIKAVIGAGAVGINFEDGRRDPGLHARKIQTVRATADQAGVNLFINARTDIFLQSKPEAHADGIDAAIERVRAYADAGANGFFAPGLVDPELIRRICDASPLPVNIMAFPGVPDRVTLASLGVARISHGPGPYRGAMQWVTDAARIALG
jgi:2-methylisocitrate lyase-like PEP mutase family enzyme